MPEPTFLLGVGAMKAGTTWLHDHLAASPETVTGYRKEYHVLDAVDLASEGWMRARIAERARRAARAAVDGGEVDAGALHQASMVFDVETYPDHFAGLLARGARLTMDVTPSYALLGADRLRWVRTSFESRGIRPVVVFVMRDPVERIWSHVRMALSRSDASPLDAEEQLRTQFAHPRFESRTRYERTLAAIGDAFPDTSVHVGLYESLFTDDSVAAVSRLAGITPLPGAYDVRSNASPPAPQPSQDTVRRVARHYAATYRAAAEALPGTDLASVWPSMRLL